jgi:uncharacterized protein YpmB
MESLAVLTKNPTIKWIIIAILVIVASLVVYLIYRSVTKVEDVASSNEVIERANQEMDVNQLTLTTQQLHTICEKLYDAMSGFATDEDAIYDAISMCETRSDLMAVIATFGVKDGQTLAEWLYDDLDGSELAHLNAIISSKNINYKF